MQRKNIVHYTDYNFHKMLLELMFRIFWKFFNPIKSNDLRFWCAGYRLGYRYILFNLSLNFNVLVLTGSVLHKLLLRHANYLGHIHQPNTRKLCFYPVVCLHLKGRGRSNTMHHPMSHGCDKRPPLGRLHLFPCLALLHFSKIIQTPTCK